MKVFEVNSDDLRLVCAVFDLGSLRAAGVALGLSPPAMSKRLADLEMRLGVKLFDRSTRRLSATPEGRVVADRARTLVGELDRLAEDLRDAQELPQGRLKLVSSLGFGRRWLGPEVARFSRQHPQLDIQVLLRDRLPDLNAEGIDAAVWLWQPEQAYEGHVSARKIARNRRILVAAPSYVTSSRRLATVQDLQHLRCLRVQEHSLSADVWVLNDLNNARAPAISVRVNGPLVTNSGELAMDWCLRGEGVLLRSAWDAQAHLQSGKLVHLLPRYAMTDADVHWLTPFRLRQTKRVRMLQAHLTQAWAANPWA